MQAGSVSIRGGCGVRVCSLGKERSLVRLEEHSVVRDRDISGVGTGEGLWAGAFSTQLQHVTVLHGLLKVVKGLGYGLDQGRGW